MHSTLHATCLSCNSSLQMFDQGNSKRLGIEAERIGLPVIRLNIGNSQLLSPRGTHVLQSRIKVNNLAADRRILQQQTTSLFRVTQRLGRLRDLGDILKGDHHALDDIGHRAVGPDSHDEGPVIAALYLCLLDGQIVQHRLAVARDVRVYQRRYQMLDRTAGISGRQGDDLSRSGSKPADAEFGIQEDRGNLRAVQQILHVVVGLGQLVDAGLQLRVDGG